jgi:hypothetical protein
VSIESGVTYHLALTPADARPFLMTGTGVWRRKTYYFAWTSIKNSGGIARLELIALALRLPACGGARRTSRAQAAGAAPAMPPKTRSNPG